MVRAEDLGLTGTELPAQVDAERAVSARLEAIRGAACVKMGFAGNLADATENSPAVPKVGFVSASQDYMGISGKQVSGENMDICARVISVFKCHKACPLTAASAISVAAAVPGTIVHELARQTEPGRVRIGHPSGVMTMFPYLDNGAKPLDEIRVSGVAVQRTARRIMDGTVYIPR